MADNHKTIHLVAATVFGLVSIVHAIRIGMGSSLVIGSWNAPMWLSWLGVFVTGTLSVLLWESRKE